MRVSSIDWAGWIPSDIVSITYVLRGHEVLLIEKKRGLGAGKVNAPGGRLEPGETPAEAAARELEEEVGLVVRGPLDRRAEHRHQFVDGLGLFIHVFVVHEVAGRLVETDEARPFWVPREAIPLDRMWADNRLWVPRVLAGEHAVGRFVFDDDKMVDHELEIGAGLLAP